MKHGLRRTLVAFLAVAMLLCTQGLVFAQGDPLDLLTPSPAPTDEVLPSPQPLLTEPSPALLEAPAPLVNYTMTLSAVVPGTLQARVEADLVANARQMADSYDYEVIAALILTDNSSLNLMDTEFMASRLSRMVTLDLRGHVPTFTSGIKSVSSLTTVRLPDGVVFAPGMFAGCSSLTTLAIGGAEPTDNVIDLSGYTAASYGEGAFRNCSSIRAVKLAVNSAISNGMFYYCSAMATLSFGSADPIADVIDLSAYAWPYYEESAFIGCRSIKTVKLAANIPISKNMFWSCEELTTLAIGSGQPTPGIIDLNGYTAASYGNDAFQGCKAITTVKLPAGVPLSEDMFIGCDRLNTLCIGTGAPTPGIIDLNGYTAPIFGRGAFTFLRILARVYIR